MNASRFPAAAMAAIVSALIPFSPFAVAQEAPAPDASATPVLTIDAGKPGAKVSPILYGLMTEEINYSYDGGLYAELMRNRAFQDNPSEPVNWLLTLDPGAAGTMSLDREHPLNAVLPVSLKLEAATASATQRVGIANEGFWGIPVKPGITYRLSFYAKAGVGFVGPVTAAIVSNDSMTIFAQAQVAALTADWKKYELTLTTNGIAAATKDARLLLWTTAPGTIWFDLVSLFPPTWNNRPNGNRVDIMQLLADLKPKFLRFPGGNYLEGNTIATRFKWQETIGDLSQRPGHMNTAWRYRSSDGMGLMEFLLWAQDLKAEPILGVYAGYSLQGEKVPAGPEMEPYVQEALDEIEYVIGGTDTKWGARRAQDGHPAPFPLRYVEVGNEDNLERQGRTYDARFAQFANAIRAKYPQLQIIASTPMDYPLPSARPDVVDEHFYPQPLAMQALYNRYDSYDRAGPKVFVGEFATRMGNSGPVTGNLLFAVSDAAFLTGVERNSDVVIMAAYAPLFANVNQGGFQWRTDLIGYDALTSYGSPSYYVQKMFNDNLGDVIIPVQGDNVPAINYTPAGRRGGAPGAPRQLPTVFYSATRDTASGKIFLKLVNSSASPQPVKLDFQGVAGLAQSAQLTVLTGDDPAAVNTVAEPNKIVSVTTSLPIPGASFTHTLPPYSASVLAVQAK